MTHRFGDLDVCICGATRIDVVDGYVGRICTMDFLHKIIDYIISSIETGKVPSSCDLEDCLFEDKKVK